MSRKTVFVTVGTTKFDDLITTVLSSKVLEVLNNIFFMYFSFKVLT